METRWQCNILGLAWLGICIIVWSLWCWAWKRIFWLGRLWSLLLKSFWKVVRHAPFPLPKFKSRSHGSFIYKRGCRSITLNLFNCFVFLRFFFVFLFFSWHCQNLMYVKKSTGLNCIFFYMFSCTWVTGWNNCQSLKIWLPEYLCFVGLNMTSKSITPAMNF